MSSEIARILSEVQDGDARADDTWEELSKNHLEGRLMASPAVWGNTLILRSDSHLYRIGERRSGAQ